MSPLEQSAELPGDQALHYHRLTKRDAKVSLSITTSTQITSLNHFPHLPQILSMFKESEVCVAQMTTHALLNDVLRELPAVTSEGMVPTLVDAPNAIAQWRYLRGGLLEVDGNRFDLQYNFRVWPETASDRYLVSAATRELFAQIEAALQKKYACILQQINFWASMT